MNQFSEELTIEMLRRCLSIHVEGVKQQNHSKAQQRREDKSIRVLLRGLFGREPTDAEVKACCPF